MIMENHYRKINLQVHIRDIRQTPGAYCMSFGFDIEKIKQSIATVGLLNPPLLVKGREGLMEIVAGYRRIAACRALHHEFIPCCDLSAAGFGDLDLLLLNFQDNRATREFNPIEKGMFLARLLASLSEKEILRDYMPLLGLPCHAPTLQMYAQLEMLDDAQRQGIADQTISVPTVRALHGMDKDIRSILLDWIMHLHLNFNQQLQFIEWVIDLSLKEGIDVKHLLHDEPFQTIWNDRKMNMPQKAAAFLDHLRSRRYPRLVRAEKEHQKQITGIAWPAGTKFMAPLHFESPYYRLNIEFINGADLRQKLSAVSALNGLEKIQPPWEEDTSS